MNLTRRILEGIHEVELDITPEFQVPEKLTSDQVDKMLTGMGWTKDVSTVVTAPGRTWTAPKVMLRNMWRYPGMYGKHIVTLQGGGYGVNGSFNPNPGVDRAYSWGADWGEKEIDPTLHAIEKEAKELVEKFDPTWAKTKTIRWRGDAQKIDHEMEAVGWKAVASSGTGVTVFARPSVNETISVTVDDDYNIVGAEVVFPDGKNVGIDPPTVENIVARAKALESWA